MIPYQTDPTLHDHEPPGALLDDGFSPPPGGPAQPAEPAGETTDVAPPVRHS